MVKAPRVALILGAEQAPGIAVLLLRQRRRDGLRILLRLGEVDRDVHVAVCGLCDPLPVLCDPVRPDIVAVSRELIEVVRRLFRALFIAPVELPDHLRGARGEAPHELCVKEVRRGDALLDDAAGSGILQEPFQDGLQGLVLFRNRIRVKVCPRVLLQAGEEKICRIPSVLLPDQLLFQRIGDQCLYPFFRRTSCSRFFCHFCLLAATGPLLFSLPLYHPRCSLPAQGRQVPGFCHFVAGMLD